MLTTTAQKNYDHCQRYHRILKEKNPFFYYDGNQGCFLVTFSVWVEVFYTENVRLNLGTLVEKTFKRRRVGYGKPKKPDCKICNLSLNIAKECNRRNCLICPKITTADSVKSTAYRQLYPCMRNVRCQVENVIYLIECTYPGCGMQYVGETQHSIGKRIAQHLNDIKQGNNHKSVPQHINSHETIEGYPYIKIAVLEIIPDLPKSKTAGDLRKAKEQEWIRKLGTKSHGLNRI